MARELTDQQRWSLARKGSYKQYHMTRTHYETGTCPFCLDNGLDPKVNEVEYNNGTWLVWQAPASLRPKRMQNGLLRHVMIVPIEHDTLMFALTKEQKLGFFDALEWAHKHLGIDSGLFFSRPGDLAFNGGTEFHPSFQFKVPDRDMPNRQRLDEVFIKSEADEAENWARGERFAMLYEKGVTPEQFDQMVTDRQITKEGFDFPPGE
jgi:hypothetical protein